MRFNSQFYEISSKVASMLKNVNNSLNFQVVFLNFIKKNAYLLVVSTTVFMLTACSDSSKTDRKDVQTILTGRLTVVVDESLEPIVEDQTAVFESTYVDADITLRNEPEKRAVNLLLNDSINVAVLARKLTKEERSFFEAKKIIPREARFAIDGIALIANRNSTDSVVHVDDLINSLRGKPTAIETLVFDNPNSSTVRYLQQLAGVDKLPDEGVYALSSNADVIKYVDENTHAVGVIGINWIFQPDPDLKEYVEGVKVLGVKNQEGKEGDDAFYKPSQTNLALGKYPLARDLYIINVQGIKALGLGFSAFLTGERGQRIVLKSGLMPDSIPPREINIIE